MTEKPLVVELSDLIKDDSLLGKSVEVRGVVVEDYYRYLEEGERWPAYNGTIRKDKITLPFEGEEDFIGIDVVYLQSQRFGHQIFIQGEVCLNKDNKKYLQVSNVDWTVNK